MFKSKRFSEEYEMGTPHTPVSFREIIISNMDNFGVVSYGHKLICIAGPVTVADNTEWIKEFEADVLDLDSL